MHSPLLLFRRRFRHLDLHHRHVDGVAPVVGSSACGQQLRIVPPSHGNALLGQMGLWLLHQAGAVPCRPTLGIRDGVVVRVRFGTTERLLLLVPVVGSRQRAEPLLGRMMVACRRRSLYLEQRRGSGRTVLVEVVAAGRNDRTVALRLMALLLGADLWFLLPMYLQQLTVVRRSTRVGIASVREGKRKKWAQVH